MFYPASTHANQLFVLILKASQEGVLSSRTFLCSFVVTYLVLRLDALVVLLELGLGLFAASASQLRVVLLEGGHLVLADAQVELRLQQTGNNTSNQHQALFLEKGCPLPGRVCISREAFQYVSLTRAQMQILPCTDSERAFVSDAKLSIRQATHHMYWV